ncbi:toprim domain-containing protein [Paenibacillus abyssi]|uniref:Toprim domain-containing protein n=1 Tax=Paenibacillus abyssi TaxID=1340531 RepID=A0A917FIZ9_9BACL|nr:toprim domain-containing protein [Paenibacillus abyssi]GGF88071.1 hypothetical protein GCM10010916_01720 [Paenibacillus abyssi]
MLTIRGPSGPAELDVDIRAELEDFPWIRPSWSGVKLIAASPFRYDRTPSFFVNLEHGGWADSGASDPEYSSGGFVKLLVFLRDETYEETCDYLHAKYGQAPDESAEITLKLPRLKPDVKRVTRISSAVLDRYKFRSPYLGGRGISEPVQRLMRIGYDKRRRAVTIPWFNPDGTLGNVKYRHVDSKTFWYESNSRPIREMLYAIDVIYRQNIRKCAIVEAEIDALTLMSAGIPAIATGGTAFTAAKRDLILRSPIEEITLYRDNDAAGRAWRNRIVAELGERIDVRLAVVPIAYKDVNEWANNVSNTEVISKKLCRKFERFQNFT